MRLAWRWAALKNGFQDATAYRIEFLFEILGGAFVPVAIQLMLWYAIFKLGGAEHVAGKTAQELIHYTIISALFSQVRGGDQDFELQEMIRSGALSNYLLRPVGVIEFIYLRGMAPKVFVALLGIFLGSIASLWMDVSPARMVGGMLLALVGNIIHYQIGAVLSTAAFYWEEAYSVLMVKNLIVGFLSGELLPLYLIPEQYSWIWKSLPFYLYVFGPTQYALGQWSHREFLVSLGIGLGWALFFWAVIRVSWGIGGKKYQSLGG